MGSESDFEGGAVIRRFSRKFVYEAIDGEREYQDAKWNPSTTTSGGEHSVGEWLIYMRDYIEEALHILTRTADPEGTDRALHNVRKVAAMGVVCMEEHGAPLR